MSTEHQQYSLQNQAAAIQQYAALHGFEIVKTYSDPGKSGLLLKRRKGLSRLLQDVVSGNQSYRAILVYDVSRWGRFQDTDEAAHYEFVCKSAGVPVHYCAETFVNDGTLPNLIMKTLKRVMAGEYSRELSVKVFEGQKRLAQLGVKTGGKPGYGLRRFLISADGIRRQQLAHGDLKSLTTDRVILIPGPAAEVACVREIYRMAIRNKKAIDIARELNRRDITYFGHEWGCEGVLAILRNPKYTGCNTWGRTSQRLGGPTIRIPRSQWTMTPGAFEPIVDQKTYDEAQQCLGNRTFYKTNERLLDDLRRLLKETGRLSENIIDADRTTASFSTYRIRFGNLKNVYDRIGYRPAEDYFGGRVALRKRTVALRKKLIEQIVNIFGDDVALLRKRPWTRATLQFKGGPIVSVLVCHCCRTPLGDPRWVVVPLPTECELLTLICRCTVDNTDFEDFHLRSNIPQRFGNRRWRFRLKMDDQWLRDAIRVTDLSQLRMLADSIRAGKLS